MGSPVLLVAMCAAAVAMVAGEVELYSDKYDYVDVDGILSNDRIRNQYYNCFLDTAPCLTPDAKFFRGTLYAADGYFDLGIYSRNKYMPLMPP